MAPLILSRTCYHSASTYSNLTQELCSSRPVQLDRPSNQQEIDSKALDQSKRFPGLYLADASKPAKDAILCYIFEGSKISVNAKETGGYGVAEHLDWVKPVANVALFEKRAPQDPKYPRMRLIGVYPVRDGWAHISPKAIAGKGQDCNSPLYAAPRGAVTKLRD